MAFWRRQFRLHNVVSFDAAAVEFHHATGGASPIQQELLIWQTMTGWVNWINKKCQVSTMVWNSTSSRSCRSSLNSSTNCTPFAQSQYVKAVVGYVAEATVNWCYCLFNIKSQGKGTKCSVSSGENWLGLETYLCCWKPKPYGHQWHQMLNLGIRNNILWNINQQ